MKFIVYLIGCGLFMTGLFACIINAYSDSHYTTSNPRRLDPISEVKIAELVDEPNAKVWSGYYSKVKAALDCLDKPASSLEILGEPKYPGNQNGEFAIPECRQHIRYEWDSKEDGTMQHYFYLTIEGAVRITTQKVDAFRIKITASYDIGLDGPTLVDTALALGLKEEDLDLRYTQGGGQSTLYGIGEVNGRIVALTARYLGDVVEDSSETNFGTGQTTHKLHRVSDFSLGKTHLSNIYVGPPHNPFGGVPEDPILPSWPAGPEKFPSSEGEEAQTATPVSSVSTTAPANQPAEPKVDLLAQSALGRSLSKEELTGLASADLRLVRNGMFARNGYRFHDPGLQRYFGSKSWYHPSDASADSISKSFSAQQQGNLKLILELEKGAQASTSRPVSSKQPPSESINGQQSSVNAPGNIVGRWGRTMRALQDVAYQEYQFFADGTYTYSGLAFARKFRVSGRYELLSGGRLLLKSTKILEGKDVIGETTGQLVANFERAGSGFRYDGMFYFQHHAIWDSKRKIYIDETDGQRMVFPEEQ